MPQYLGMYTYIIGSTQVDSRKKKDHLKSRAGLHEWITIVWDLLVRSVRYKMMHLLF